jgi:hypothetical protein
MSFKRNVPPQQVLRNASARQPNKSQSPGIVQPRVGIASTLKTPPVAPTVFHPQQANKAVPVQNRGTTKQSPATLSASAPKAPAAYRPQPIPRVLQTKTRGKQLIAANTKPVSSTSPVAPLISRPGSAAVVAQMKTDQHKASALRPKPTASTQTRQPTQAPPVYRPERQRIVQPKTSAAGQSRKTQSSRAVSSPQSVRRPQAIQCVLIQNSKDGSFYKDTDEMSQQERLGLALELYSLHNIGGLQQLRVAHPTEDFSDGRLMVLWAPHDSSMSSPSKKAKTTTTTPSFGPSALATPVATTSSSSSSFGGGSIDELTTAAHESAEMYRKASEFTGIRRPSTICYVADSTNPAHRASGASGFGGGMWRETELNGVDLQSISQPQQGFALLDERLAKILKAEIGVQWKAINCAEVKALNNLLTAYPTTDLKNVDMASFWVSDGKPAAPCDCCQRWVFKYLHTVKTPG